MPYLPRSARCGRANGRNAMSDGPRSTCGGSVRKLGGLSDILLAYHDDVFFAARAWLGEIDRAAEDGGAYLLFAAGVASFTGMHSPGTGNR